MKVLVVGGGGREHALVWKLAQSTPAPSIYCAPGNVGIADLATCIPLAVDDIEGLVAFARQQEIELVVVGPEAPLVAGLADACQLEGIKVFGPGRVPAALEGSKVWAKQLMERLGIPTAGHHVFHRAEDARAYLQRRETPCVVKADGLAAGKGVIVAADRATALEAVDYLMEQRGLGEAGHQVVIEDFLQGEEVSILAFCDGKTVLSMAPAQDHKRVMDGDQGPNTGGMGAYSPAPCYSPAVHQQVVATVLEPVVAAMAAMGHPYRGVLYAGLMLTAAGPQVLEFNVRFGDPETQALMMLLETDLLDVMQAVTAGELSGMRLNWYPGAAACVVLASSGYPGNYRQGIEITGLNRLPAGVEAFHAATARQGDSLVTAGGRVLGITSRGESLAAALNQAYAGIREIHFEGMHFRRDVGWRALATEESGVRNQESGVRNQE